MNRPHFQINSISESNHKLNKQEIRWLILINHGNEAICIHQMLQIACSWINRSLSILWKCIYKDNYKTISKCYCKEIIPCISWKIEMINPLISGLPKIMLSENRLNNYAKLISSWIHLIRNPRNKDLTVCLEKL
jgi:hypothetical protein